MGTPRPPGSRIARFAVRHSPPKPAQALRGFAAPKRAGEPAAGLDFEIARFFKPGPRGAGMGLDAGRHADELVAELVGAYGLPPDGTDEFGNWDHWQLPSVLIGDYLNCFGRRFGEPALLAAVKRRKAPGKHWSPRERKAIAEIETALLIYRSPGRSSRRRRGERRSIQSDL